MTELELSTEFVSHNLVYKTEFVENNRKFAYEMTMAFNETRGLTVLYTCTSQIKNKSIWIPEIQISNFFKQA